MMTGTAPSPGELTCVGKPDGAAEPEGLRGGSGAACPQHRGQVVTGMAGGRPRGTLCSGMAGGAGLARLWAGGSVGRGEASASAQEEKGSRDRSWGVVVHVRRRRQGAGGDAQRKEGETERGKVQGREQEKEGAGSRDGGTGRPQGRQDEGSACVRRETP